MRLPGYIISLLLGLLGLVSSNSVPPPASSLEYVDCGPSDTSAQCRVIRVGDASSVEKRDIGARVYYDNSGAVVMVLSWVLNNELSQLFQNSGYNLAKDIANNCRMFCLNSAGDRATYLTVAATWTGMLELNARYLSTILGNPKVQYGTFGVVARTLPNLASETAGMMSNWFSQGAHGAEIIYLGSTSAIQYVKTRMAGGGTPGKREVSEEEDNGAGKIVARDFDYCAGAIGGMYNSGTAHTPRNLYYTAFC